jgi:hypothetical protein
MKLQLQILFGTVASDIHKRNKTTIIFFYKFSPDIFNYSENDINETRMSKIIKFDLISNTRKPI